MCTEFEWKVMEEQSIHQDLELQVIIENKLACQSFMDADRTYKAPGSEAMREDFFCPETQYE